MRNNTYLIIANPNSGTYSKERMDSLYEILNVKGIEYICYHTNYKGEIQTVLPELLAENSFAAVITCGGDGLINEVVNAMMNSGHIAPLIPLPFGTANILSYYAGIGNSSTDWAELFDNFRTKKLNLGNINGQYFFLAFSIGLDANCVQRAEGPIKKILGKASYGLHFLKELFHLPEFQFKMHNEKDQCLTAHKNANNIIGALLPYYGIKRQIFPDNHGLNIRIFSARSSMDYLRAVAQTIIGSDRNGASSEKPVHSGTYRLQCTPDQYIQIDGDIIGQTPAELKFYPSALEIRTLTD